MSDDRTEIEAFAAANGWTIRSVEADPDADPAGSMFGELVTYERRGVDVMIVWSPNGDPRSAIRTPSRLGGEGRADFARDSGLEKAREWLEEVVP